MTVRRGRWGSGLMPVRNFSRWCPARRQIMLPACAAIAAPMLLQAQQRSDATILEWKTPHEPVEYRFEEEQVARVAAASIVSVRVGRATSVPGPCETGALGGCTARRIRIDADSLGVGVTSKAALEALERMPAGQSDLLAGFVPFALPPNAVAIHESWPVRHEMSAVGAFGRGTVVYTGSARLDSVTTGGRVLAFISLSGRIRASVSAGPGAEDESMLDGAVIWDLDAGRLESGRVRLRGAVRNREDGSLVSVSRERLLSRVEASDHGGSAVRTVHPPP